MNRKRLLNIRETYSVWEYLVRLSAVMAVMFLCFILLGVSTTPLSGFITSSISFSIVTIASAIILLRDFKWVSFFFTAYLVRLVIGLVHFLIFLVPDYFGTSGTFLPMPHDFTYAFDSISEIVLSKNKYGLFHYEDFYIGHREIWNLISYPFYYFGVYILNIAPLNSFMSIFASINLLLISKHLLRFDTNKLRYVAILSAYFPLTLISSLFYRDIVGMGLMSLGLVLIMFSKKNIFYYLMIMISGYLFYLQRTIYPLVLVVSVALDFMINGRGFASSAKRIFSFIIFFPAFIVMLILSFTIGLAEGENSSYIEGAGTVNYAFLPLKLLMGLIGPFPWFQYFTTGRIEYSYQFADYLQGVFNLTTLVLMKTYFSDFFRSKQFNILNFTGLFLMAIGLSTTFMHSSYVSIGFLFLIPWIVNSSVWNKLKYYYVFIFMIMLIFSVFILTVFGGLGLAGLWK